MQARIGIATVVVVVGDLVREGVTQENAAIGETTNVAARLQSLAEPNTLLVCPETHRLVGMLFEYRDLGRQDVKGFLTPVHAHQVTGASRIEDRFEARERLQQALDFYAADKETPGDASVTSDFFGGGDLSDHDIASTSAKRYSQQLMQSFDHGHSPSQTVALPTANEINRLPVRGIIARNSAESPPLPHQRTIRRAKRLPSHQDQLWELKMIGTMKTMAAAALFAATASMTNAAPVNLGQVPDGVSKGLIQVHGEHRSCERGRRGWHRHNRYGERRRCREWRGEGRRPERCVRVGPLWYCDY